MRYRILIPLILACWLPSAPGTAGDWADKEWGEVPDWAATLGLFVFGGPAASPVDIRLNDQMVAAVAAGDQEGIYEILAALNTGVNELEVEFRAGEATQDVPARLSVALATSQVTADGNRRLDEAIAETALPPIPATTSCKESFRFWAGPPPTIADGLKRQYFLTVQGPPVGYLVTIRFNEQPIYTTTKGERFFEVTSFIQKGKNVVSFDVVPACFPDEITADGKLTIIIAAGKVLPDGFEWDNQGQLLGQLELEPRKNPQPFTRRQNFRAR